MRERTYWVDHVLSESNKFTVIADQGDIYTITPYGIVMQQGTFQDAAHFNSIEEGLVANEIALNVLLNYARQNAWEVEKGTVTLTNAQPFPFNNSQKSIALANRRENSDYIVIATATAVTGNVGEIEISEKLVNGFKIAYTGSAPSATIEYQIIGGFLK